jgi:hypothetical protein
MSAVGEPVGLLLALTYTEYVPPAAEPEIGNPIGLLLALTYSEGGEVTPPTPPAHTDNYYYAPSRQTVQRMLDILYPKKRRRKENKAKRLERMAVELLNEFEPGPDLPPLDLSALRQAIAMLDEPIRINRAAPDETRKQVIVKLFETAAEYQQYMIEEDDDEVLEMAIRAMLN